MNKLLKKYKELSLPIKCTLWFTFVNFLQRGINVIVTPIFTRLMTTKQYSLYSVYTAWSEILVIFTTLYLNRDVIDKCILSCSNKKEEEKVVSAFQGLSFTIACGFLILYLIFHDVINNIMDLPGILVLGMFISFLFIQPLRLWTVYKRYSYQYQAPVLITGIVAVLTPVIAVICMIFTEYKGEARVLSYIGITVAFGIGCFINNIRKNGIFFDKKLWKYAAGFNLFLIPHFLSEVILNHSDRIMINSLVGGSETAIYAIAYSISQLVLLFTQALNMAFVPWQYKQIKSDNREKLGTISSGVLVGVCVILLILMAFAPEAVYLFAGEQYMDSVALIPVISLGVYFSFMYQFFTRVEVYYEKKENMASASIIAAIANIVLNYVCIKLFGYKAAAYTTLVCYILLCVMHYLFYRKICREHINGENYFDIKTIFIISIVMCIMTFLLLALYANTILRYLFLGILFLVILVFHKKALQILKQMKKG